MAQLYRRGAKLPSRFTRSVRRKAARASMWRGAMTPRRIWYIVRTAALDWQRDDAPRLGAAIAYYAIFSIAPLLVIAIAIAGSVFGEQAARGEVFTQAKRFLDNEAAAHVIEDLILSAARPRAGTIATLLSFVALWIGASGVFAQIKGALNIIWEVQRRPGAGVIAIVIEYAWSVVMVAAVGLLLLVSLVASSALAAAASMAETAIPISDMALRSVYWGVSLAVLTTLFAAIFKFLPDVIVRWRDVWLAAFVTSALFMVGRYLIGLYLARLMIVSAYGAAGSFVLLLVWTYYSAQIFLYGAELSQVYARAVGSPVFPKSRAQFLLTSSKPDRRPPS
jgi:membrane protein